MSNKGKFICGFCKDKNTDTEFIYNQSLGKYQKVTKCFNNYCIVNNLSESPSFVIQDLKKEPLDVEVIKETDEHFRARYNIKKKAFIEKSEKKGFFDNLISKKDEDNVK